VPPADARPLATAPCVIQAIEIRSTCSDNCLVFMRTRPSPAHARASRRGRARPRAPSARARATEPLCLGRGAGGPRGRGCVDSSQKEKTRVGTTAGQRPTGPTTLGAAPLWQRLCGRATRQTATWLPRCGTSYQRTAGAGPLRSGRWPTAGEGGGRSLFLGGTTTASAYRSPQ